MPRTAAGILAVYLIVAFALMVWPHQATVPVVTVLGFTVEPQRVHDLFFRYSVMGLVIVPAIMLLELASVGWARSSMRALLRGDVSGRSDLICFVLVHLRLMRWPQILLTFGFAIISADMAQNFVHEHLGLTISTRWIPIWLRYPAFFLLYTLLDYIAHRVDHSDLFWPLHRYHHGAEDFHVLTADRGHPASALTQGGLKILPLAMLGVPVEAIIDIGMLLVAIDYLNHSRIDWDFGWFGRWVIQSPRHHQLHHARDGERVWNFSACPLWDHLGGTWCDAPRTHPPMGTTDMSYRHGLFILPDLWRDYRDFLGRLTGRRL